MTRSLTTALRDETLAGDVKPIILIDLDFSSGFVRFWTGYGDLVYNNNTYVGTGTLLAIDSVNETTDVAANGVGLTLNGIPSDLLSIALTEHYQGRSAKIYFGALSDSYGLVADPFTLWSGRMDTMSITEGAETATIRLVAENRLIDLERQRERRLTDQDQQTAFPNDLGLQHVAAQQDKEITWGR